MNVVEEATNLVRETSRNGDLIDVIGLWPWRWIMLLLVDVWGRNLGKPRRKEELSMIWRVQHSPWPRLTPRRHWVPACRQFCVWLTSYEIIFMYRNRSKVCVWSLCNENVAVTTVWHTQANGINHPTCSCAPAMHPVGGRGTSGLKVYSSPDAVISASQCVL